MDTQSSTSGAAEGEEKWGVKAHGERAEREPITGVWGQSPQRGPGAEFKLKFFFVSGRYTEQPREKN